MNRIAKAGLIAFGLIAAGVVAGQPARADNVTVGVGPGGIAFGYSDGYWDREHHWHQWRNHEEAVHFRAENRAHYYDRRHDHERDEGWRDHDRWWDRH